MTLDAFIEFLQKTRANNPSYGSQTIKVKEGGEIDGISLGMNSGLCVTHDYSKPKHSHESSWETMSALFQLAGLTILNHWELPNNYWPDAYIQLCASNPWWLVSTKECGLVRIGWRKKVISIDWENFIWKTEDEVSGDGKYVHAWKPEKAVEYLRGLREEAHLSAVEK